MTDLKKIKPIEKILNASVKKKPSKPAMKVPVVSAKKPPPSKSQKKTIPMLQKIEVPNAATAGFLHEMQRQPL